MVRRAVFPSLLQSIAVVFACFLLTATALKHRGTIALNGFPGGSFLHFHRRTVDSFSSSNSRLHSVPEWTQSGPPQDGADGRDDTSLMTVRFINTPTGKDVITRAEPGANLLVVGDNAGVKLPRACRTGLCGSCTCEVQDPLAVATSSNPREGFATIRACSSKCFVPEGMTEMVVDIGRMRKTKKDVLQKGDVINNDTEDSNSSSEYSDPMLRFSGNWEKEFRPSWDSPKVAGMGQVGGAADSSSSGRGSRGCSRCAGAGRVGCYTCNGEGQTLMGDGSRIQCSLCVGLRTVSCAYCRGSGSMVPKKKM